jgi:hypothetical protein
VFTTLAGSGPLTRWGRLQALTASRAAAAKKEKRIRIGFSSLYVARRFNHGFGSMQSSFEKVDHCKIQGRLGEEGRWNAKVEGDEHPEIVRQHICWSPQISRLDFRQRQIKQRRLPEQAGFLCICQASPGKLATPGGDIRRSVSRHTRAGAFRFG